MSGTIGHIAQGSALCILLVTGYSAQAVECQVQTQNNGYLTMLCDGKAYRGITDQNYKRMQDEYALVKKERDTLKQQLKDTGAVATDIGKLSDQYRQLGKDHAALTMKYKSTLDESVGLNEKYSQRSQDLLNLTDKYDHLVLEYNDLTKKYRDIALSGGSFISFDVGLGATSNNGSAEAAALVGMHISRVNIWGFLQQDNSGVLVGTSFGF